MVVLNIPIEPLEERYSVQWNIWFLKHFIQEKVKVITIYGDKATGIIEHGSFLDVLNTNEYKTSQLNKIITYLKTYKDNEKLVLFFHDLWFPGLTNIAYIREGMGFKNIKIVGCLHAGSYDKFDFLNKANMTKWACFIEKGWFNHVLDEIYVATHFHKQLLLKKRVTFDNIKVTGFPIFPIVDFAQGKKENIIVFPHRLDSEKQPELFDNIAKSFFKHSSNWLFLKTKEQCTTKEDYYELLGKSKIAISFALQETWGIAMQEALFLNNLPLVPNRLSYVELYQKEFQYCSITELMQKLRYYTKNESLLLETVQENKQMLIAQGKQAIPNIIKHIKNL